MPLAYGIVCCLITTRIISVKIGLFFQEITFKTEFPGSNFLLPTFLTGGKSDFQVANLLLATDFQLANLLLAMVISNPGTLPLFFLSNLLFFFFFFYFAH